MSATNPRLSVLEQAQSIVGGDHVLTDAHSVSLFAQDVHTKGLPALAVVRPENTEQLAAVVSVAVRAGHAVIARGGGMSYTSGYVPKEEGSILIDTGRMNRILEINTEDMYVTVQSGCTWKALHEALSDTGYRTPYWGTLSGIHATVGGGMSQNSIFWGSARYGTAVDSVLGMEIVLADGSVVKTGAGAQRNATPFFRHFGPDLTGLFTSDAGSLGLKASVTLRLIPIRPARAFASFHFNDESALIDAMSAIARADIAAECFGFDPYLQSIRMQRESIVSDVKKLAGVVKASGSVLGAIKDSAKVALAGRGYMRDVEHSLHVLVEERIDAAAEHNIAEARKICARFGGKELADSIPKILRANPFTPLNNVVGPGGERWVPIHTIVPHSKAKETMTAIHAVLEQYADEIEKHGIGVGYLLALIATNGFVIEPVFFTPDAMTEIHEHTVEPAVYKNLKGYPPNAEASELTNRLRREMIERFSAIGGVHMQIGKTYPYRKGLEPASWRVIEDVKTALDPNGRVNPGALGFD